MTILSFAAVFAGLGLGTIHVNYMHALLFILGIILGSTAWWLLLSGCVAFILHHRITPMGMRAINWISGIIILAFSIIALWR
jgi:arginine exporter protein ArgO